LGGFEFEVPFFCFFEKLEHIKMGVMGDIGLLGIGPPKNERLLTLLADAALGVPVHPQ
jgi:hypothetical protein